MLGVERAVDDPRVVQRGDLLPELVEQRVVDVFAVERGERAPTDRADHEERRSRPRGPGYDHARDAHARVARDQHRVGLVLDLLEAREREPGPRVLVHDEAPELREEARVGLVAADHLHAQRALVVAREHERRAGGLRVGEPHVVHRHPELRERPRHLQGGRAPAGRAEHEVHGRRDGPSEHDAGEQVVRVGRAEVERRDHQPDDEHPSDHAGGPSHIRARRRDHGHGDRGAHGGERRRGAPEAGRDAHAAAEALVLDHDFAEQAADRPRQHSREQQVACETAPAPEQRRRNYQAHRPQRAEPVDAAEHGRQPAR